MDVGGSCPPTSLLTGFSEWGLSHISHAWNSSPQGRGRRNWSRTSNVNIIEICWSVSNWQLNWQTFKLWIMEYNPWMEHSINHMVYKGSQPLQQPFDKLKGGNFWLQCSSKRFWQKTPHRWYPGINVLHSWHPPTNTITALWFRITEADDPPSHTPSEDQ